LNRFEKHTYFIQNGMFFKVVSSKRVLAQLLGGSRFGLTDTGNPPYDAGGQTFYPSVEGGFRGREFVFVTATVSQAGGQRPDLAGDNFFLLALEKADWSLSDLPGKWTYEGTTEQRDIKRMLLLCYLDANYFYPPKGPGFDTRFYLKANGDVMLSSTSAWTFMAVPAVTGGFRGKLFFTPSHMTFPEEGTIMGLVVVPLEAGKVTVYKRDDMSVVAEREFSDIDVSDNAYWYLKLGKGRMELIVQSTGDVTLMAGSTRFNEDISYLGDDITFMGSRPNQEIRFYAPTSAVVFAPQDTTATIDGVTRTMKRDEFKQLDEGVHSVKADGYLIVEILGASDGWAAWQSYLVSPLDVAKSYEVPQGFVETGGGANVLMYVGVAAVAVVVLVAVAVLRRRRPKAPSTS
jgi:hypothetical protein